MRSLLIFLALLSLFLICTSCSNDIPSPNYHLVSISPSPARPGENVIIYGKLPQEKVVIFNQYIETTPIPNGLQFTLPSNIPAGVHNIQVGSYSTLQSSLLISPVIERLSLSDNILYLYGKGWLPNTKVNVIVNRQNLAGQGAEDYIQLQLPPNLRNSFGILKVQILVNEQVSNIQSLKYEAASIRGSVTKFSPTEPINLNHVYKEPLPSIDQINIRSNTSYAVTLIHQGDINQIINDANNYIERTWKLPENVQSYWQKETRISQLPKNLQATCLRFPKMENMHTFQKRVYQDPRILSVEISDMLAPSQQGGKVVAIPTSQWHLERIHINQAWQYNQGKGIIVAILDSGVDLQHPDLKKNLLPGYDFIDLDNTPQDRFGHGTHVAGLVAAEGQVFGVAPQASILPIRVLEGQAGGTPCDVARGILWAVDALPNLRNPNPANILNLSLGSSGYNSLLKSAVKIASANGALIFAATGNQGKAVSYPAAFNEVIAVTSLAGPQQPYQPWYANRGSKTFITAYGGDITQDQDNNGVVDGIYSTDINGYGYRMGTSMASPQVAGLAALMLARGVPSTKVIDRLAVTADDLGILGRDQYFGYGLANARAVFSNYDIVVIARSQGTIASWGPLNTDNTYDVHSIPINTDVDIFVASDQNHDGIYGGNNEFISDVRHLRFHVGEKRELPPFILHPSQGDGFTLPQLPSP